jgi:hypothetical protein
MDLPWEELKVPTGVRFFSPHSHRDLVEEFVFCQRKYPCASMDLVVFDTTFQLIVMPIEALQTTEIHNF